MKIILLLAIVLNAKTGEPQRVAELKQFETPAACYAMQKTMPPQTQDKDGNITLFECAYGVSQEETPIPDDPNDRSKTKT